MNLQKPRYRVPLSILLIVLISSITHAAGTKADYQRADQLRNQFSDKVFRDEIQPHWLKGNGHFWYQVQTGPDSHEFVLIDAEECQKKAAFDHKRLAAALNQAGVKDVNVEQLALEKLQFDLDQQILTFQIHGTQWVCNLNTYQLDNKGPVPEETLDAFEPDNIPDASRQTGKQTTLTFVNRTDQDVELFWLDTAGQRVSYGTLKPTQQRKQNTYAGHIWVIADMEGETICGYRAEDEKGKALIGVKSETRSRQRDNGGRRWRNRPQNNGQSPNGSHQAFIKDSNVWIRNTEDKTEIQLSQDGTEGNGYTNRFFWSPDSAKLVSIRRKDAQEHKVYLIESSPKDQLQPKLHSFDYLKPGDQVEIERPGLFDIQTKKQIPVDNTLFDNPYQITHWRWSPDSSEFTFLYNQRGHQVLRLVRINAETGQARTIIDETSETFICYSSKMFIDYLDESNEIIWMSERDGWNHLYLYDAKDATVKKQITQGTWVVRDVVRVDKDKQQILFTAGAIVPRQDPYYVHYCRVNFDGSDLRVLTEGDGTHTIDFSPDGRFFIDRYSRVDMAPVHELRRSEDGSLVCELERADIGQLLETGWQRPERFCAKGRDGATDIYGIICRPTTFDPEKTYPIIEQIYAGPQSAHVPKNFRPYYNMQRLAELGFVVVNIDGMGTSHRSKKFHDVCWKNLADAGLPDRIEWIKAAARKYPYMDTSRVGIFGGSAGGQNAAGALMKHGDFYKVGIADCGCHDNRMDKIWWNEQWMGWPVGPEYEANSNVTMAPNLQGKLLLIVGELDRNVDPASTMQVVDALIKADKDFDMLVVPGGGHGAGGGRYGARRQADYFVRHLLGVEPRAN